MYEKIRESFLDELSNYYSTGEMPAHASVNMRRALTEHSDRLRRKGVKYTPRFISTIDERPGEVRFDTQSFITCNCYKHCNTVFEYSDGVTGLRSDEATDDVVYLQVIDRKDADKGVRSEDQIIICPNCGKEFTIDESSYESIVKQIRDHQFNEEIALRERQFKENMDAQLKLARAEAASTSQKQPSCLPLHIR